MLVPAYVPPATAVQFALAGNVPPATNALPSIDLPVIALPFATHTHLPLLAAIPCHVNELGNAIVAALNVGAGLDVILVSIDEPGTSP